MGHVRLGRLPRTRPWQQVVGLIAGGADTDQVATATLNAAAKALSGAARDAGLIETVWLLMRLPFAARSPDFRDALRGYGVVVSESPGLVEIVAAVTEAIDAKLPNNRGRTDLGEMGQMAAAETITEVLGGRTRGLFGTTPEDVRQEFGKLATSKQFGIFAKDFFGRFINKCLDYCVSRTVSDHLGTGRRFTTLAEQSAFTDALRRHCREAAQIVETYSGDWLSKANWETKGEITRKDVAAFTGYAMTKLTAELNQGASQKVPQAAPLGGGADGQ
jgi:hypothetical protein